MKLSTRKALRTFLQALIGGAAAVPAIAELVKIPAGPVAKVVAGAVVAAAVVTKVWNAVEAKWPGAGSWLLRGSMVTTDAATGEVVAAPASIVTTDVPAPVDPALATTDRSPSMEGYAVIDVLLIVVLVVFILWLVTNLF